MVHWFCWRPLDCNHHWLYSVCFFMLLARIKLYDIIRNRPVVRHESATLLWTRLPGLKAPRLIATSSVFFTVMRRNPFMVDGCCRKGSRNALQELYNPTQVGRPQPFLFTSSCSCAHVSSHPCVKGLFEVHRFSRLRFYETHNSQILLTVECVICYSCHAKPGVSILSQNCPLIRAAEDSVSVSIGPGSVP